MKLLSLFALTALLVSGCATPNLHRDCTDKCSKEGMTCDNIILGGNNPLYSCKPRPTGTLEKPSSVKKTEKSDAKATEDDINLDEKK